MHDVYRSEVIRESMQRNGFAVVDLFTPNEIAAIYRISLDLINSRRDQLPGRYFPVGQLADFNFRNASTEIINKHLVPKIYSLFKENAVAAHSGTHLIKPRGFNSFLPAHQDSSIVDEKMYNSILVWCPLHSIQRWDGPLYVLKGSHLFGNHMRSTTIPWLFRNNKKLIYKYSKKIDVRPGQVCLFHAALIHYSGYNIVSKYRMAVSTFVTDRNAPLLNYYFDKEKKSIEKYEVDNNYYHNYDFNLRPGAGGKLFDTIPYDGRALGDREFMSLVKQYTLS